MRQGIRREENPHLNSKRCGKRTMNNEEKRDMDLRAEFYKMEIRPKVIYAILSCVIALLAATVLLLSVRMVRRTHV